MIALPATRLGFPDVERLWVRGIEWLVAVPADETRRVKLARHATVAGRDRPAFDGEMAAAALEQESVSRASRGHSERSLAHLGQKHLLEAFLAQLDAVLALNVLFSSQ